MLRRWRTRGQTAVKRGYHLLGVPKQQTQKVGVLDKCRSFFSERDGQPGTREREKAKMTLTSLCPWRGTQEAPKTYAKPEACPPAQSSRTSKEAFFTESWGCASVCGLCCAQCGSQPRTVSPLLQCQGIGPWIQILHIISARGLGVSLEQQPQS